MDYPGCLLLLKEKDDGGRGRRRGLPSMLGGAGHCGSELFPMQLFLSNLSILLVGIEFFCYFILIN